MIGADYTERYARVRAHARDPARDRRKRPTFNLKAVSSRVAVDDEGPRIRAVDHTFYLAESFLLSGVLHRLRGSG